MVMQMMVGPEWDATNAKTRRRYHDVGPGWMCTDLMNIAIDIDSGPPG
jgi:hypothetical protein